MIEYTLLNVLLLELKIYCVPDKFYRWLKFGQYDEVKNRAPFVHLTIVKSFPYKEQEPTANTKWRAKRNHFAKRGTLFLPNTCCITCLAWSQLSDRSNMLSNLILKDNIHSNLKFNSILAWWWCVCTNIQDRRQNKRKDSKLNVN